MTQVFYNKQLIVDNIDIILQELRTFVALRIKKTIELNPIYRYGFDQIPCSPESPFVSAAPSFIEMVSRNNLTLKELVLIKTKPNRSGKIVSLRSEDFPTPWFFIDCNEDTSNLYLEYFSSTTEGKLTNGVARNDREETYSIETTDSKANFSSNKLRNSFYVYDPYDCTSVKKIKTSFPMLYNRTLPHKFINESDQPRNTLICSFYEDATTKANNFT
jgi:hypothetical protein